MKVYVIPAGEGFALPLPAHLAAALGLRLGSAVEIRGPGADGSLRFSPIEAEEPVPDSPPGETAPPIIASRDEPVASRDVAAVVASPPRGVSIPPPPVEGGEFEDLIARHAGAFRELCE